MRMLNLNKPNVFDCLLFIFLFAFYSLLYRPEPLFLISQLVFFFVFLVLYLLQPGNKLNVQSFFLIYMFLFYILAPISVIEAANDDRYLGAIMEKAISLAYLIINNSDLAYNWYVLFYISRPLSVPLFKNTSGLRAASKNLLLIMSKLLSLPLFHF